MKWLAPILFVCCVACETPSVKHVSIRGGQMVEVITQQSTDTTGIMYLWERTDPKSAWKCVDTISVSVGRNGMAPADTTKSNHKREGDGCSPSGTFPLSRVFSYSNLTDLRMPFEQVDTNDLCVDDAADLHYNMLVDKDTIANPTFTSFETMRRNDEQYAYGVWVDYNTPAVSGNGSCIFLHIWKSPGHPTSGCTAMAEADMLKLIHWLDGEQFPILYQHTLHEITDNP